MVNSLHTSWPSPPSPVYFINMVLPSKKVILKAMTSTEGLWDDMHHRSYFPIELDQMEFEVKGLALSRDLHWYQSPIYAHDMYAEGNMKNMSNTMPIDISTNPVS